MQLPLPFQMFDTETGDLIGQLSLDWIPYPGSHVQIGTQFYLILEKRHAYCLKNGRYQLTAIRAYGRLLPTPLADPEQGWIGDPSCRFNAHSPLLRCSLHPTVPTCSGCLDFEGVDREGQTDPAE